LAECGVTACLQEQLTGNFYQLFRKFSNMLTPQNSAREMNKDLGGAGGYPYEQCDETGVIEKSKATYDEILAKANRIVDIQADCWGALFFVVVRDIPALLVGFIDCVGRVRIAFSVVVFLLNLFIQATLLYFICKLLMMPSMFSAQTVYKDFTENAFEEDAVSQDLFDELSHKNKDRICGLALSQVVFVRVIIFLWISTNVAELKDIYKKMLETVSIPPLPEGLDRRLMVHDNPATRDVEILVVCMTLRVKILLFIVIYIPRVLIAMFLIFAGSLWLMSAEKISDLILNSLALAFVTNVDELICAVFFPPFFIHDIENLALACQEEEHDPDVQKASQLKSFMYSSMVLIMTSVAVELAVRYQPIIHSFQGEDVTAVCLPYLESISR